MPKVLIVDDDPGVRAILERLFARAGFQVGSAATAEDALALAGAEAFDAAILDFYMPGRSGVDLYDALAELRPALARQSVFLTGMAGDEAVRATTEARGVPLIDKLADLQLAVDAVRLALLRRH